MGISSTGLGSGLDVESIISGLMAVESRPITLLQNTASTLKSQLSSFGQLQSYMSTFRDKLNSLTSPSLWSGTTATSNDTSAVTVSTGTSASSGSYAIAVSKLAAAQTATSTAFASSATVLGEGSLTISLGTWSGTPATSFAAKAGTTPVTVTIGPGETSLASIRDKINKSDAGVTASIINDASGARLSIRSASTGEENGFQISSGDAALSALTYAGEGASPMALNQKGVNAEATINGIAITSASNTLSDVADGLTVNLLKTTTSEVGVTVASDTNSIKDAVNGLVTSYNALVGYIASQTKYDPSTKVAGTLQGDRTTVGLQNQLRSILGGTTTASTMYTHLSDVGIELQKDGTLKVNSTKLNDGLGNLNQLRQVLVGTDDTTPTSNGILQRFKGFADQVLGPDGSLETRTTGLQTSVKHNTDQQDAMQRRLDQTEKRLRAQYEALDANMAKLSQLSGYMTQQLSALKFNS
jgi:flagellar hook-associated protein 2